MKFSKISKSDRKKNGRWQIDLDLILTFYDAYAREKNITKVAEAMETTTVQLKLMIKKHPEFEKAMEVADRYRSKNKLSGYITRNLSKQARKAWDSLQGASSTDDIEAIFHGHPLRLRQQLFCHALLHTGYDLSKACHMVGISFSTMKHWKDDLDFLQMLEEMQFHKKNFFERSLVGLVEEAHPAAVIFANRTLNADRGYNEKIELRTEEHNANSNFEITDLDLPLEVQKMILKAIDKKQEQGDSNIKKIKQIEQ